MPTAGGSTTGTDSTGLNISSTNLSIRGARFLGFRALNQTDAANSSKSSPLSTGVDSNALIAAVTSVDEPIVLPVLQFHAPSATLANSDPMPQPAEGATLTADGINGTAGQWTLEAVDSQINAYFVAGNTPSRVGTGMTYVPSATAPSTVPTRAETGGGLANFIRFGENWLGNSANILGGFIQNSKSKYATAPFSATAPYVVVGTDNQSDIQTLFINPKTPVTGAGARLSGYSLSYRSATGQRLPFYSPPQRLWGFDVGFLTQAADRFSERFATAIPGANEFFRELDASDTRIQKLLCAVEPANLGVNNPAASPINPGESVVKGTQPQNYTVRALRGADQPTDCNSSPTTYVP
ncbi:MAG: hypothetical protein HC770_14290 [Pseudanabaena sp. CRU_2_10]|nr:hypothetical protein [Pseudanabaena sp. CRU_2_10]